ncbi:hypothetical protein HHO41_12250 [Bacillus sp. DNRA2]|uniref:M56 family metallopeptidase n=1 Tax=Bacillus sp. DNRA2 TaxID=2723053 RepID=UPI00145CFD65|nr:M56 family metallopeptidase [Bacillus sp. DNRA2]NMD71069.1 hypothetical protein [Bacillus sp. DNRA2]
MIKEFLMNNYFLDFFNWIIETSISASFLVVMIIFVKSVLKSKLTPRWHYLLWMILIVRMIFPWSPISTNGIYSYFVKGINEKVSIQTEQDIISKNADKQVLTNSNISPIRAETASDIRTSKSSVKDKEETKENSNATESAPSTETKNESVISSYVIAYFIWLTGTFMFGALTYLIVRNLNHYIQKQPSVTETHIVGIFEECKKIMGVKKSIPILLSGKIASPTILGFFRPKILLGNEYIYQLSEQQLRHIFLHELAHIKRNDVGLNWVMHLLLILNWFNPILWWAYIRMREDQELACDALALTVMDENERLSYGRTIISQLERYANHYPVPNLANFSKNKKSIKRRIILIKNFDKKSYQWSLLGVFAVVIVSIFSILNTSAEVRNEQQEGFGKESTVVQKGKEEVGNTTIYTPPHQEEDFKDMSKNEVALKLLNSVDYFHTIIGKYETHDVYYDNSTSTISSEFQISNNDVIGGYEKYVSIPDKSTTGLSVQTNEMYYDDKAIWIVNPDKQIYQKNIYDSKSKKEIVKPEDVFTISPSKIYDSQDKFRERPPVGIFAYEETAKYLRYANQWNIENQNEELLGHNTIVLFGKIDKSMENIMQPQADTFRFWVDKDTGLLLKRELYNSSGEIISYFHPEVFKVNVPIDPKNFVPSLEGYQEWKIGGPHYKDPKEKEIKVIENAESNKEEVDQVVQSLRTKFPALYQFTNPDFQLFSASMEKYIDDYHAYFVYYYNKDVEINTTARVIYVRSYQKNTVVRSTGDFATNRGKKLDAFTINGIKWSVFEVKNTPDFHFVGRSGDYKYEMVVQGISLPEMKDLLKSFEKSPK